MKKNNWFILSAVVCLFMVNLHGYESDSEELDAIPMEDVLEDVRGELDDLADDLTARVTGGLEELIGEFGRTAYPAVAGQMIVKHSGSTVYSLSEIQKLFITPILGDWVEGAELLKEKFPLIQNIKVKF